MPLETISLEIIRLAKSYKVQIVKLNAIVICRTDSKSETNDYSTFVRGRQQGPGHGRGLNKLQTSEVNNDKIMLLFRKTGQIVNKIWQMYFSDIVARE